MSVGKANSSEEAFKAKLESWNAKTAERAKNMGKSSAPGTNRSNGIGCKTMSVLEKAFKMLGMPKSIRAKIINLGEKKESPKSENYSKQLLREDKQEAIEFLLAEAVENWQPDEGVEENSNEISNKEKPVDQEKGISDTEVDQTQHADTPKEPRMGNLADVREAMKRLSEAKTERENSLANKEMAEAAANRTEDELNSSLDELSELQNGEDVSQRSEDTIEKEIQQFLKEIESETKQSWRAAAPTDKSERKSSLVMGNERRAAAGRNPATFAKEIKEVLDSEFKGENFSYESYSDQIDSILNLDEGKNWEELSEFTDDQFEAILGASITFLKDRENAPSVNNPNPEGSLETEDANIVESQTNEVDVTEEQTNTSNLEEFEIGSNNVEASQAKADSKLAPIVSEILDTEKAFFSTAKQMANVYSEMNKLINPQIAEGTVVDQVMADLAQDLQEAIQNMEQFEQEITNITDDMPKDAQREKLFNLLSQKQTLTSYLEALQKVSLLAEKYTEREIVYESHFAQLKKNSPKIVRGGVTLANDLTPIKFMQRLTKWPMLMNEVQKSSPPDQTHSFADALSTMVAFAKSTNRKKTSTELNEKLNGLQTKGKRLSLTASRIVSKGDFAGQINDEDKKTFEKLLLDIESLGADDIPERLRVDSNEIGGMLKLLIASPWGSATLLKSPEVRARFDEIAERYGFKDTAATFHEMKLNELNNALDKLTEKKQLQLRIKNDSLVPMRFRFTGSKKDSAAAFNRALDMIEQSPDAATRQRFLEKLSNSSWGKSILQKYPELNNKFEKLIASNKNSEETAQKYEKYQKEILELTQQSGLFQDGAALRGEKRAQQLARLQFTISNGSLKIEEVDRKAKANKPAVKHFLRNIIEAREIGLTGVTLSTAGKNTKVDVKFLFENLTKAPAFQHVLKNSQEGRRLFNEAVIAVYADTSAIAGIKSLKEDLGEILKNLSDRDFKAEVWVGVKVDENKKPVLDEKGNEIPIFNVYDAKEILGQLNGIQFQTIDNLLKTILNTKGLLDIDETSEKLANAQKGIAPVNDNLKNLLLGFVKTQYDKSDPKREEVIQAFESSWPSGDEAVGATHWDQIIEIVQTAKRGSSESPEG